MSDGGYVIRLGPLGATATTVASALAATQLSPDMGYANPSQAGRVGEATETSMSIDERLLNAKIEASEARTDAKFSQFMAELRLVSAGVSQLSNDMSEVKSQTSTLKWNIVGTGLAIGGLILAIFAFGTQMLEFALGLFTAAPTAPPG